MKINICLALVLNLALLFLAGCQKPSRIELPIPNNGTRILEGQAADDYAAMLVINEKTAAGRVNELAGKLAHYYGLLFIFGLMGLGACILLYWMKIPVGRFLWIVPIICFGGMAFIHFWSEFARYIGWGVAGIAAAIIVWKLVEWKKERQDNAKNPSA